MGSRRILRTLCSVVVLSAFSAAQVAAAPYLWWKVELKSAVAGPNGLVFDVLGETGDLELVFSFANEDTAERLWLSPRFLAELRVTVMDGAVAVPTLITWESRRAINSATVDVVGAGETVVLEPDARFESTALLRRISGEPFSAAEYRVAVSLVNAVQDLKLAGGRAWQGKYVPDGEIVVRVSEPRTVGDQRKFHLTEGQRALSRGDGMNALGHFRNAQGIDPENLQARAGLGEAFLQLGQFLNAVAEFERVLPTLRGERSPLYLSLAYSYVGLGNDQKAAAVLAVMMNKDAIQPQLEKMRQDIRQRWGIR